MISGNIKVGVITYGFNQWGGGVDFIIHLLTFLQDIRENDQNITVTIFLPKKTFKDTIKNFLYPWRILVIQFFHNQKLSWQKRSIFSEAALYNDIINFDSSFEVMFCENSLGAQVRAAKKKELDLIFPCIDVPSSSEKLPWIGYLADLQHLHMPDYFSEKEIKYRNKSFNKMLNTAKHIIVYSDAVHKDIEKFFPMHKAKIYSLPFGPFPQIKWLESDLDVREKYGIYSPYFLICNQFWVHKDHVTALRAYAKYCQLGGEAKLVCTGKPHDPRFPNYFNELLSLMDELGILNKVKVLGYISKEDQVSLLKKSLAVIQPTLFEGGPGGGSSYDAISLGVPVIASNIPINMEMNCGEVVYFGVGNDEELSSALLAMERKVQTRKSNDELWVDGLNRKKIISKVLLGVLNRALNEDHI